MTNAFVRMVFIASVKIEARAARNFDGLAHVR